MFHKKVSEVIALGASRTFTCEFIANRFKSNPLNVSWYHNRVPEHSIGFDQPTRMKLTSHENVSYKIYLSLFRPAAHPEGILTQNWQKYDKNVKISKSMFFVCLTL
jgi:hypothetical protein